MSKELTPVETSTPEQATDVITDGLTAAEKKRQKNKKKKERQKQKKKDQKPSSTEDLAIESSIVSESPILDNPPTLVSENQTPPNRPTETQGQQDAHIITSADVDTTEDVTRSLADLDRTVIEPTLHEEVAQTTEPKRFEKSITEKEPEVTQKADNQVDEQELFGSSATHESLPWDQPTLDDKVSFEATEENQDVIESPVVQDTSPNTAVSYEAKQNSLSEVLPEAEPFLVSQETTIEIPAATATEDNVSQSEFQPPVQAQSEITEILYASEDSLSLTSSKEVSSEEVQSALNTGDEQTIDELFSGNGQTDFPWNGTEVNETVQDTFTSAYVPDEVDATAATAEITSAPLVDPFSPNGNDNSSRWNSTDKAEPFPIKEVELEEASNKEEAQDKIIEKNITDSLTSSNHDDFSVSLNQAHVTSDTAESTNNYPFGGSKETDLTTSVAQEVNASPIHEDKSAPSVEDKLDNLFGPSEDDSFSAVLKQDSKRETAPQAKEKKFSFLDDDLLDDDLLGDEFSSDNQPQTEAVATPSESQGLPQANRYQPQRPQVFQQTRLDPYNPYGQSSSIQPTSAQSTQHHLDLKKLIENKKKSDAYDFPADLIPAKPVKSTHHTAPNPYASSVHSPSVTVSPAISHPPVPPAANAASSSPLAASHYKPVTASAQQAPPRPTKKSSSFFEELPISLPVPSHARAARGVSISSSGTSPRVNQPLSSVVPPNPYAINTGSVSSPVTKTMAGNRYRVTSIGSNASSSSFQPPQQFGPQLMNPSTSFNSFSPAVPLGGQGDHARPQPPSVSQGRYAPAQLNQPPQFAQQLEQQGQPLPPTGLGFVQGQASKAYGHVGFGFQPNQPPVANPQLSPLLNQVGNSRYGAPHLTVPTQNISVIGSLDSEKSSPQATASPSASKYAPINHRRQASATANQYDPYSLAKFNQQNQPPRNNQRFSTIQQQQLPPQGPPQVSGPPHGFAPPQVSSAQQGFPQQVSQYQQQWAGYQPHVGARVFKPEQLLNRQYPLFSWSNRDKLAYFVPGAGYQANHGINVVSNDVILQEAFLKEFPGASKRNIPSIIAFLDKQIDVLTTSRSTPSEEGELVLAQLLKHKLSKSSELFSLGVVIHHEQPQQPLSFKEKRLHQTQPLSKRQLVGLISSGENEKAVSLALQHENFALALVVSSVIGKDAWIDIVSKYLEYEFKGDQDNFLSVLITVLAGDFSGVIESFRNDAVKKQWAIAHWRELYSAVVANKPIFLNQFLAEFGSFLAENDQITAAYILFITGELPLTSQNFKPLSLKLTIYLEIYALVLQEKGVAVDLSEIYLQHANWLADYNLLAEAQRYTDLAASALKVSKASSLAAKYTYSLLNDQISGATITDGSWFGRPKFDKVWGQLDKSLNKFISGDDIPKPPPKEGVFSKFSPNISRASSYASIPNAMNNGSFDSRPSQVNQGPSVSYSTARSQSHSLASVSSSNPPLRSFTPSTAHLQQVSQPGYAPAQNISAHSPAFAPPPMFGQDYGSPKAVKSSLNISPGQNGSRYTVPGRSPTTSNANTVNEELQNRPNVSHTTQSSSLTNIPPPRPPQSTTGKPYAPPPSVSQSSSNAKDQLPPTPLSVTQSVKAPSNLHLITSETDAETTAESADDLASTLSEFVQEEKGHTQALGVQSDIQPTVTQPFTQVDHEQRKIAKGSVEERDQLEVTENIKVQDTEEAPTLETKVDASAAVYEVKVETPQPFIKEDELSLSQGEINEETGDNDTLEAYGSQDTEQNHASNDEFNHSKANKSVSDFGSATVSPYVAPTEFVEQQNTSEEFKEKPIESENPRVASREPVVPPAPMSNPYVPHTPTAGPPSLSRPPNPYAPISAVNGIQSPRRSSSASRFTPKSYTPVDGTQKAEPVVPVTNQDIDFYAISGQARPEPTEAETSKGAGPKLEMTSDAPVETLVAPGLASKVFDPRNLPSGAPPRNLYAPSVSTPTASRKSSYNPINSYAPPAQDLSTSGQSRFEPYQPNISGSNTVSTFKASNYDIPSGQASNFDDFKPPAAVSLVPNDPGSPSARMMPYQPPTTNHNITNIAEVDEEYYDDVVDESEDEDDDEDAKNQKEDKRENKQEEEKQDKKRSKDESGSGWFTWLRKDNKNEPKVYRAKLGEQNNFYYDEDLKRWINKAIPEDEQKAATPPPPPPIIKKKPSNLSKPRSDSFSEPPASSSSLSPPSGPLKPPSAPGANGAPIGKRPVTSDLDSLMNLTGPPIAGTRRKKRGGRGYVDVMGSMTNDKK